MDRKFGPMKEFNKSNFIKKKNALGTGSMKLKYARKNR